MPLKKKKKKRISPMGEDKKEDENSNIHPPTTEEIQASISNSAPVPQLQPGDSGSGGCEEQQPSSKSAHSGMTRAPGAGGEAPFQPNLNFPGRRFGSESFKRSFQ